MRTITINCIVKTDEVMATLAIIVANGHLVEWKDDNFPNTLQISLTAEEDKDIVLLVKAIFEGDIKAVLDHCGEQSIKHSNATVYIDQNLNYYVFNF